MPRVLVVEDNAANLELIVALLEQERCEVLVAGTADAGLQIARTARPDVILMDIQLPGMTGYEAARQLKADPSTAAIPIIAVTAQAMRGDEAMAREAGCDAYLTKPVDRKAFERAIRRFLPPGATG